MESCCETPSLSRRAMLVGSGAMFAWAYRPRLASAAGTRDPRLIVIVLRGALDGLATVAPVSDPATSVSHGQIALSLTAEHPAIALDSFFALHPAMPVFARQYRQGNAAVVHATATGYRAASRISTARDVFQSGHAGPGVVQSGWLNRAIGALPRGERIVPRGLAIGPTTALIMRGPVPVLGWAPQVAASASDDLADRVLDLYVHRDPLLKAALEQGLDTDRIASREGMSRGAARNGGAIAAMRLTAEGAARLMAADDGPRIAALSFDGWDTHANEGGATGRLAQLLGGLDSAFEAFEQGLGARWKETDDRRRHRVWPNRPHQRHHRNGSRHRHDRASDRRRRKGRPGDRGLAGVEGRAALRAPRSQADH